jgi:hypothetical protein
MLLRIRSIDFDLHQAGYVRFIEHPDAGHR